MTVAYTLHHCEILYYSLSDLLPLLGTFYTDQQACYVVQLDFVELLLGRWMRFAGVTNELRL